MATIDPAASTENALFERTKVGDGRSADMLPASRFDGWGVFDLQTSGTADIVNSGASADPSPMADFPAVIDLADLNGRKGFRLNGVDAGDVSGFSVSSAGDVNGDGFDDIIIGAAAADPAGDLSAGESYVVFGQAEKFAASIELAALDGLNGFRLEGIDASDLSGRRVASAGDINGDGFDDIIIGAYGGDPDGSNAAGESYLVFGKATPFGASIDLATLDGSNGFRIDGINDLDASGRSVSSAGDVNGDGFEDIIIGAQNADPDSEDSAGESYVVFGRAGTFTAVFDLETLDGTNGFRIEGVREFDLSGGSVSEAGDVNGDGLADIIIGARGANYGLGASYVVFGDDAGFPASIDLATLDGTNGFRVNGRDEDVSLGSGGYSVSSAGDINGDGFDDILMSSPFAGPGGVTLAGESYVVFGQRDFSASLDLAALDGTNGFRIDGLTQNDYSGYSVSSAGDVDGDGFDDIIIGAFGGDPNGVDRAGESYVIFGQPVSFAATFDLSALDGANGFRIDGIDAGDVSGFSVSGAGDINGDGFDDVMVGATSADPSGDSGAGESYVIFGRAPDEAVRRVGSRADQTIRGGDFDDTLLGKGGADTLAGGAGKDKLTGGKGADDFLLASRDASDADRITDFNAGTDEIALDGDVFGLAEGALAAGRFVIGDAAADANDRLIYDDATGRLFFDADGTGAQAQVLVAFLTGAPTIEAGDFIVI